MLDQEKDESISLYDGLLHDNNDTDTPTLINHDFHESSFDDSLYLLTGHMEAEYAGNWKIAIFFGQYYTENGKILIMGTVAPSDFETYRPLFEAFIRSMVLPGSLRYRSHNSSFREFLMWIFPGGIKKAAMLAATLAGLLAAFILIGIKIRQAAPPREAPFSRLPEGEHPSLAGTLRTNIPRILFWYCWTFFDILLHPVSRFTRTPKDATAVPVAADSGIPADPAYIAPANRGFPGIIEFFTFVTVTFVLGHALNAFGHRDVDHFWEYPYILGCSLALFFIFSMAAHLGARFLFGVGYFHDSVSVLFQIYAVFTMISSLTGFFILVLQPGPFSEWTGYSPWGLCIVLDDMCKLLMCLYIPLGLGALHGLGRIRTVILALLVTVMLFPYRTLNLFNMIFPPPYNN
jgi:hypothetical protein